MRLLHLPVLGLCLCASAQQFSESTINQVRSNLAGAAQQSWELGVRAQALLELDAPTFSVYNEGSIPPPSAGRGALSDVLGIASSVVAALPTEPSPRALIPDDGAAGDPPSIGVAVLLANATASGGNATFAQAAADQLAYLLTAVPRTSDGAISHREDELQLWSDFVYMVPPFLAYYGALTRNDTLLQLAYTQCSLYHKYLHDRKTNLWAHMALGNGYNDGGHWSTGNGWAAQGMLRVLATMAHSDMGFKNQQKDLSNWVSEILDGMFSHLNMTSLLFTNYVDQNTFSDAASSALIASAVYRLALLRNVYHHLPQAEEIRKNLVSHVDSGGWLAPVVNPEDFGNEGSHSPEGEAFVLLLHSAWRDWVAAGSQGANSAGALRPGMTAVLIGALVAAFMI